MSADRIRRPGQEWARIIRDGAPDREVCVVIDAINVRTASYQANRGAVIVACAQILAQSIVGEPSISAEIRAGIVALIDGFAMQAAIQETL
jgi:hypothetical protein